MHFLDSSHVWHVAKTGNDGNGGHAQQYPVAFAADAKLTVSAAITAASAGDTIIIWPGTYAEGITVSKSLNIIGTHRALCKVNDVVINADDVYMENVTVDGSGNDAFTINDVNNIHLHRCTGITTGIDGLIFGGSPERIRLTECYFKSGYDGLQLTSGVDVLIDKCFLESTGASVSCVAARGFATGTDCRSVIVKDTIMIATTTQGVPVYTAHARGTDVSFINCVFRATASTVTGEIEVVGLKVAGDSSNTATALCINGSFDVSKGSPNYGILAGVYSDAQAFNCGGTFERTSSLSGSCTTQSATPKSKFKDSVLGVLPDDFFNGFLVTWTSGSNTGESKYVTDYDESDDEFYFGGDFTNDIEVGDAYTIAVVNHTALCSAPSTGQVKISHVDLLNGTMGDGVTKLDEESVSASLEAAKLDAAAKMLVNKAIQNKSTGAVDYYDDDGETKILTHTPTDSDTQITRTPG